MKKSIFSLILLVSMLFSITAIFGNGDVELVSKYEEEKITITRAAAETSGLLRDMLEEQDEEEEDEVPRIPVPNVEAKELARITDLMLKEAFLIKQEKDVLYIREMLEKMIKKMELEKDESQDDMLKELYLAARYLACDNILHAVGNILLVLYPDRLFKRNIDNIFELPVGHDVFKIHIKSTIDEESLNPQGKNFNAWFDRAKTNPKLLEEIIKKVWVVACKELEGVVRPGDKTFMKSFKKIEESVYKMALRYCYFEKFKRRIDSISKKLFVKRNEILVAPEGGLLLKLSFLSNSSYTFVNFKEETNDIINNLLYVLLGRLLSESKKIQGININITNCNLTLFPDALINCPGYCKNIKLLNLSGNKLTELPELMSRMRRLEQLGVNNNPLKTLPRCLLSLSRSQYNRSKKRKLRYVSFGGLHLDSMGVYIIHELKSRLGRAATTEKFGRFEPYKYYLK